MLTNQEQEQAIMWLIATAEAMGQEVKPATAVLMVDDLSGYSLDQIGKALRACRQELKGRLALSGIIQRISGAHPSPNEAWAIAIRARDEAATVVWTPEIKRAFFAGAYDLLREGDKIGARMAFIESYEREVSAARVSGTLPVWEASLGENKLACAAALRDAVERGLLRAESIESHLLIDYTAPPAVDVAGLLEGKSSIPSTAPAEIRERLKALKESILEAQERERRERAEQRLAAIRAHEQRKAETARMVQDCVNDNTPQGGARVA